MGKKCLEGIRVIDLSRLLPGPFGTALLVDLGAEVIKVEAPGEMDLTRGMPGFYQSLNRGKKSISLNLKHSKGREIFFQLLETAQVLVEQFRPGVMARLGLSYEECGKRNPRLIYASLSGYGGSGPYAQKAGHDLNYISLAGIAGITGTASGELVIPGVQIADLTGGLYLVIGILAGLQYVHQNHKGLKLEVSMFEASLSLIGMHLAEFFREGREPGPCEMQLNGGIPNYNLYQTSDGGWMSLGALEGKFWSKFCQAIGRQELELKLLGTKADQAQLKQELKEVFKSKSFKEWEKLSEDPDLCLEPVRKFSEIEKDPQVKSRGLIQKLKDRSGKEYKLIRAPIRFLEEKESLPLPAPEPGQDTKEILSQLGYTLKELEELKNQGVI